MIKAQYRKGVPPKFTKDGKKYITTSETGVNSFIRNNKIRDKKEPKA